MWGALLVAAIAVASPSTFGATTGVPVTANIASTTVLSTTGCATSTNDATAFGAVIPGTSAITGTSCAVTFGSNNDTARLRMYQSDLGGKAMFGRTTGSPDTAIGASGYKFVEMPAADYNDPMPLRDGGYIIAKKTGTTMDVARYDATGVLVAGFGTAGIKTITHASLQLHRIGLEDSRGRLLFSLEDGSDNAILRLNGATGAIDTTFGTSGYEVVSKSVLGATGWGYPMLESGDSYYVSAGLNDANTHPRVARFSMASGHLVQSWGTMGVAESAAFAPVDDLYGASLAADASGKIYAAFYHDGGTLILDRFTTAGVHDTSWATSGRITWAAADDDPFIALDASGRVYALTLSAPYNVEIRRLTTTGALDATWGTGGVLTPTPLPGADLQQAESMLVDPDGTVTFGWGGYIIAGMDVRSGIVRLKPDGSYDTTLNGTGKQLTSWLMTAYSFYAPRLTRGRDGTIHSVALGDDSGTTELDYLLAGYTAPTIDNYLNVGGGSDRDFASGSANSFFASCLLSATNATAAWTTTGTCGASDASPWNAVPVDAAAGGSQVASTAASINNGSVALRFAMRAADSQSPSQYLAPITFDVVAPNA